MKIEKETFSAETNSTGISLCTLASGSKGNAIYLSDGNTSILIDAGLSGIEIERRMQSRGLAAENLDAVLVSHEHSDHIRGVGVMARRFKLPVYINRGTFQAEAQRLGKIEEMTHFSLGAPFRIGGWSIQPFPVSHDASEPAGFIFRRNGRKIGLATDLGIATALVKDYLKSCDILILEANHDLHMLDTGPYPWPLKQRIKSRLGHLSNDASQELIRELLHDGLRHVVFAHLSETNNTPRVALQALTPALNASKVQITIAPQHKASEIIRL